MQALPLLAAGGGGLGTAATALSVGSTLLAGIGQFQAQRFQAAILRRQAEVAERNAETAIHTGQVTQQDQDFAALQEISRVQAAQSASGFSGGSASFGQVGRDLRTLARRDALRIRHDAEVEAQNFRTQAGSLRAEASQASRSALFTAVETAFGVGSDLVTGASRVNDRRARQLQIETIGLA